MLNSTVNTFYDTRNYGEGNGKEYGLFLDFCVYRVLPWGETFEESGQMNGIDPNWRSGKKCLDTEDPKMSYFRTYTFDKTVSEAEDEDAIVVPTADGTTPGSAPTPGSSTGTVAADGWAFPTLAGSPLNQAFSGSHFALDIGSDPSNTDVPIYAMRDGTVTSVGNMPMPPYQIACASPTGTIQQTVVIEHTVDGQKYISTYHHVQANAFNVKVGSVVKAGDQIAKMGNTGCSFGQHLHVELWRNAIYGGGTPIDLGPILYN
jgi:murein DD-endopeptidase MepM/ murein hydrolase activator NlpD